MASSLHNVQVRRYASPSEAAKEMAKESIAFLADRIAIAGKATVSLTGGSSPTPLFEAWMKDYAHAIDWTKVHFFWGDERNVPFHHAESNTAVSAKLLSHLKVDQAKIHYWRTDLAPDETLEDMKQVLAKAGLLKPYGGFDLTLLGVGPDGHIASLFPHDAPWQALDNAMAEDVAYIDDSPKPPAQRFTFTLPMLNRSRLVYMMPFGESKRTAIEQILNGDKGIPAAYVRGKEATIVWTDVS